MQKPSLQLMWRLSPVLGSVMNKPKGVADHPAKEQMEAIWRSGGRAKDIVAFLEDNDLPVVSQRTIARYGQRFWNEKVNIKLDSSESLDSVLDQLGSYGTISKINYTTKKYPGWEKVNGENVQVDKESTHQTIEIIPKNDIPKLFEKAVLPDIKIVGKKKNSSSKPDGWKLAVVLPDMQIGYHRSVDGTFTTTHDEAAIDVAHQVLLHVENQYGVDLVMVLGDNLDFASFSSHRSAPGYLVNTQLEIDRFGTEVATLRSISNDAEIVVLHGNHDDRLNKAIVDKIPALTGISKANTRTPVLSISNLCRFDEYNITYKETYPDGEYWANDYLRFEHGSLVSSAPGSTAAKYLNGSRVSTVYGHIHRQELVYSRILERNGSRTIFAGSPGCLSRIDGMIPSGQTGISSSGTQLGQKHEKWQQGLWLIWYQDSGSQKAAPEPVVIENGTAVFGGQVFESTMNINGERL